MTVATYTSDLTDIFLFESTTSVSAYGGGASGLGASPDYAVEGTNAVDKQIDAAEKGFLYDNVSNFTIGADDHFFIWVNLAVYGLADTRNNRGIVANIGDDTSNFVKFHVAGNDTLPLGGANPYPIRFVNTTLTNFRTLVGSPGTTPSQIGVGANVTGTAKFSNLGGDAARIGTGYDVLNGTGADPEADFAGIASDDETTREGIFYTVDGGFRWQGKLRIGSASTACELLDLNTNLFIADTIHSLTDFTEFLVENASSIVTLTNVNFIAIGTNNPGRLEAITSSATLNFTNCGFIDFGVTVLGTGSTMSGCRWIGADQVTANEADLTGSSVSGYEGTANTSALLWDTSDPDGNLDDMTFAKGTAATHAIEFGAAIPTSITLRGCDFTGYNASQDQNDSIFHFKDTSGTITINLVGCTSDVAFTTAYRTDGATIVVVEDPVTTTINVDDNTGADLNGARVLVRAAAGGPRPHDFTVTITRSGTVATVAHTAHGYAVNDKVQIKGITDKTEDNLIQTIVTVPTANTYTYTTTDSGSTSYTGTILETAVFIDGTTSSGTIADTRTFASAQPIDGFVRSSTTTPFYKTFDLAGNTISSTLGLTVNIRMQLDE